MTSEVPSVSSAEIWFTRHKFAEVEGLAVETFGGGLARILGVPFGMGWSILIYGALTRIVTRLATSKAGSKDSAGSWVVLWIWWMRRHKGWPRWIVLVEQTVRNLD